MSMNDNMADASPCDMQSMENEQVPDNMQSDCDMDDCSSCCTPISKTFLPLVTPIHSDQIMVQVSGSPNVGASVYPDTLKNPPKLIS